MKQRNLPLFFIVCILDGACILAGSVLGSMAGRKGLFLGAIIGGILGVIGVTWLAVHLRFIERASYTVTFGGGIIGFAVAAVIATTNLHTALIPLTSIALIGLGVVLGNMYGNKITSAIKLKPKALAAIGIALFTPALFFVLASLLKYGLKIEQPFNIIENLLSDPSRQRVFNLISPVIFLGGLLFAVALNLYPMVRVQVRREDSKLVSTITAEAKPINLVIVVLGCLLLVTLLGYAFLENFTLR